MRKKKKSRREKRGGKYATEQKKTYAGSITREKEK